MFRKSGLLVLSSLVVLSAPAFASGLGPAPHYSASLGAPASQRGPSAQTVAADARQSALTANAVGGATDVKSESGLRLKAQSQDDKVQGNQ
ncbi:hypothetical protein ACT2FY_24180 [Paraburkholderia fungorum]|uniref:hypothetical protein n=1 Tax=Paraburkholderia fungorum TaxID=134537 RepID=UPI00402BF2F8